MLQTLNIIGLFAFNLIVVTTFTIPAILFYKFSIIKKFFILLFTVILILGFYIYGSYEVNKNQNYLKSINKKINVKIISPNFKLEYGLNINQIEKKINITFKKIEVPALEELKSARINNWASLIINTAVDSQAESILRKVNEQFKHLDKEDILKRLITTQLDHLKIQGGEKSDLNESLGSVLLAVLFPIQKTDRKKASEQVNLLFIL